MVVETKRQAFALYHGGKFGNKLRTWDTVRDFVYSEYSGLVTMRYALQTARDHAEANAGGADA